MLDWNSFWSVFGICVAFGGALLLDRMYPNMVTKQEQPIDSYYIPDYIDHIGNVIMKKK